MKKDGIVLKVDNTRQDRQEYFANKMNSLSYFYSLNEVTSLSSEPLQRHLNNVHF